MSRSSIQSALLATLLVTHGARSPIETETLLTLAAVEPYEYVEAREVLRELRETPVLTGHGFRGVELNDDAFDSLADVLSRDCDWDASEVERRLKYYEG